jgi:hypothetical protein
MNLDTNKLQQLVSLFEQSLNYQTTVQGTLFKLKLINFISNTY